jgi:GGDEF domain-containing protein
LTEEYTSNNKETGELKFEFFTNDESDSDKKFTSSIKNLLVLIKDFYGADDALVYWFNKNKRSFKLLASSEENWKEVLKDRFEIGNDAISRVCLNKRSEIVNLGSDDDRKLINHYSVLFNIKSVIANPLLLYDEAVAVVLCESKTLNFFGTPNLYTLQVFSESITNYIKYYSLNEDFEYQESIFSLLASGGLSEDDQIYKLIEKSFVRHLNYDRLSIILRQDYAYRLEKIFTEDETDSKTGLVVDENSLSMKSIKSGKIITHFFDRNETKEYRFFKNDEVRSGLFFCMIPFMLGGICIGAIAFETKENVYEMQKSLSKAYKLAFPLFMYLNSLRTIIRDDEDIVDRDTTLFNNSYFRTRLDSEINRCRLFNESDLYCVYVKIDDNADTGEYKGQNVNLRKIFADELKEKFLNYDMLFRIEDNKFAVLLTSSSEEKIFLEFEKFRKYLSTKIYNIEGKDISFTVSCAIKKYDDINILQENFLHELNNLLQLASSEGGNSVKI